MDRPAHISIDATALLSRRFGIGHYIDNLIHGLATLADENQYSLHYEIVRRRGREFPCPTDSRFRTHIVRSPQFLADFLFHRLDLGGDSVAGFPDLFHGTRAGLPRMKKARTVWTVYDMAFRVNPDWFTPETTRGLEEAFTRSMKRADGIITISEHTRQDLLRFYDVDPARVVAIPLGASDHAVRDTPDAEGESRSGFISSPSGLKPPERALGRTDETTFSLVEQPYLLSVGTLEPRKNVERLIEAFDQADISHRLVLAGARGWRSEGIFAAMEKSPKRDRITWIDYPDASQLHSLYRHADFFAYPSLYEGFGLPVLEAMTLGIPVLTSRVSSLPEVGGAAVDYVDQLDTNSIKDGLERLAGDPALRERLRREGPVRAREFSWQETARRTRDVYRDTLAQGPRVCTP